MSDIPLAPEGTDPTSYNFNPVAGQINVSGDCPDASLNTPINVYVHTQGIHAQYARIQKYDNCEVTMRSGKTPYIESNYVEFVGDAWVNDRIMLNTSISACLFDLHRIQWQSSGACAAYDGTSGLGEDGVMSTSSTGTIVREARTNALGEIIDPSGGYQTQAFSVITNHAPGNYDCSGLHDTRLNAKLSINEVVIKGSSDLDSFDPNLVSI